MLNVYSGEPSGNVVGDRLQNPYDMRRVDHDWKVRSKRQRTDIGKYSLK
jgi:hypothetical protein